MTARGPLPVVLVAALSACSLGNQAPPPLTGPSEFALSLVLSASPDHIAQDGVSQSIVTVMARDAAGQPVHGLSLRADMFVNAIQADFGTLSSRFLSTTSDGRASVSYMAPGPPPLTAGADNIVTISMSPIGTDYGSFPARSVSIRLVRPGVILPPNGTPVPSFFFSPTQPHEGDVVQFDASGSSDDGQIVSYVWNFGDGSSGAGVKVSHIYTVAGSYAVTLTVKDDRGISVSSSPVAVPVGPALDLLPGFTVSPTNPSVGSTVNVNAAATIVPPGRTIAGYQWDFGDGATGSGPTTSHVYLQARTFTIVLTVTDSAGRKASASRTVTIGP